MKTRIEFPSNIKFSKGDKNKGLFLPSELTEDLAYICGVLLGDGHLHFREEKKEYSIKCVGHPTDEKEFYDNIIIPILKKVFGIEVEAKLYDNKTTYGFQIFSKSLANSLVSYSHKWIFFPIFVFIIKSVTHTKSFL